MCLPVSAIARSAAAIERDLASSAMVVDILKRYQTRRAMGFKDVGDGLISMEFRESQSDTLAL